MRVVCGLRNPGADYRGTRHNLGYEVVVALSERLGVRLRRGPLRVRAEVASVPERSLLLAAPNTYMNESGRAVGGLLAYYRAAAPEMLVVHDDIDLPFGRLRIQEGGGSGGHNGVRSLEAHLRTRAFWRLKMGVGRPPGNQDPAEFVLHRFSSKEREEADLMVADAADVVDKWLNDPVRAQEQAAHRRV